MSRVKQQLLIFRCYSELLDGLRLSARHVQVRQGLRRDTEVLPPLIVPSPPPTTTSAMGRAYDCRCAEARAKNHALSAWIRHHRDG